MDTVPQVLLAATQAKRDKNEVEPTKELRPQIPGRGAFSPVRNLSTFWAPQKEQFTPEGDEPISRQAGSFVRWYLQIPGPYCNDLLHDAFGSFTGRMFRPRVQQEAMLQARWASGGQKQLWFVVVVGEMRGFPGKPLGDQVGP